MKKRRKSKNIYDEYITIDNLYKMWSIIKTTCKNKREVYYLVLPKVSGKLIEKVR